MRSARFLLVVLPLSLVAAGCDCREPNGSHAAQSDAGMKTARPAADATPAESAVPRDVAPRTWPEPSTPIQPQPDPGPIPPRYPTQSGLLTSGSIDDVEKFDDYLTFLDQASPRIGSFPRLQLGRRILLEVADSQGKPLGGAQVVVTPIDSQPQRPRQPSLEVRTASDGRAMFLAGVDGPAVREYSVEVRLPGQEQPFRETFRLDEALWRVSIPDSHAQRSQRLDLTLVLDTTGSMGDELRYLQAEIDSIAKEIHRAFPSVDQRFALILYRDEGDEYVVRSFDFTGDLDGFRSTLAGQSASGGGDEPEAVHLALEQAERLSWREGNTARVLFLVGDAPPHTPFAGRTLQAIQGLRRQGVRIYPVACSGSGIQAEYLFRAASLLTMAEYLFLTDHSGVGNAHAQPHTPQYQVEHLDRLMIRMIASELCGRRLPAGDVIAVESLHDMPQRPTPGPANDPSPNLTFRPLPPPKEPARSVPDAQSMFQAAFGESPHWLILVVIGVGALLFDAWGQRKA